MNYDQWNDYRRRYRQWDYDRRCRIESEKSKNTSSLSILFLALIIGAMIMYKYKVTKSAQERINRNKVKVVKGTVLSHDSESLDSELVVSYEQDYGKTVNRSFYLDAEMPPQMIPRVGDTVLVSWNSDHPEGAYLMPIK